MPKVVDLNTTSAADLLMPSEKLQRSACGLAVAKGKRPIELSVGSSPASHGRAPCRTSTAMPRDAACSRRSSKDVEITYSATMPPGPIPSERPDPSKPNPRLGVGLMCWSSSGRYLATRNDNMASTLWVWDAEELSLSSLVLQVNSPSLVGDAADSSKQRMEEIVEDLSSAYVGISIYAVV